MIEDVGIAVTDVLLRWRRGIALLVGVDRGNVGGGVSMTGLLAMPDEILEVLYRRHLDL